MTPGVPLLALPPRYTADSIRLWRAAVAAGWDVERLHHWQVPPHLQGREVKVYGESFFCRLVAETAGLALEEPPLTWLTELPERYRHRWVSSYSLAEAAGAPGPAFFKPADDKHFPAAVYPSGSDIPGLADLPADTVILAAEPVEWEVEYRCFVAGRRILAHSIYLRAGELAQTAEGEWPAPEAEEREALEFAASVLTDPEVAFPAAVVLDVGRIADRGWAVVEANPAWGAGIYGCDPAAVLPVIAAACRPDPKPRPAPRV